jgi:hypothetical protein
LLASRLPPCLARVGPTTKPFIQERSKSIQRNESKYEYYVGYAHALVQLKRYLLWSCVDILFIVQVMILSRVHHKTLTLRIL